MSAINNPFDDRAMIQEIEKIVSFGIRRPGYPGDLATEQYLLKRFEELSLEKVHLEPVPVNNWKPATTRLTLEPDSKEIPCFAVPYTDWTPPTGVKAPAVYVEGGTDEDFQTVDVEGKIVVADICFGELNAAFLKSGAHFIHDLENSIPDGPLHCANWLITNFSAYYQAWQRGGAAFIGLLKEMPINGCELYVPYDGYLKKLPAAWIGRENAEIVRKAARRNSIFELSSDGETNTIDSHNVIGTIPGNSRESIIVTCHHDAPFASAVEDASGLAVLLALAETFSKRREKLERNLIFLAASGHFHGAAGTRSFVEKHRNGLLKNTVAAIGVEHIAEEVEEDGHGGYRKTGRPEVRALFMDKTPALIRVVEESVRNARLDRSLAVDAFLFGPEPPCDSAPFFTAGIPSVCHISGPLYLFDPHDTIDKVRTEDLPKAAQMFSQCIESIDSIPADELSRGMKRRRDDPPSPPPSWFLPPESQLNNIRQKSKQGNSTRNVK